MFGTQAAKPAGGFGFGTSSTSAQPQTGSVFGISNAQSSSGGLFGQSQPQQSGGGLFGNTASQAQPTGGLFGTAGTVQPQASGGLFGTSTAQQQASSGGLFGGTTNQQQQQPSGGLFGTNTSQQQQPSAGLFGTTTNQQQQQQQQQQQPLGGLFSSTNIQSRPNTLFGSTTQTQPQNPSLFGQTQQSTAFNALGQSQQQQQTQSQRPLDQTLRFGQSQHGAAQSVNGGPPLWEEGRGLGVYRSIPTQMGIIKDKWDPASVNSQLRAYLYQHVGDEAEALRYRPGPGEDDIKWEEAVGKRPGPSWVPLLVRGFFELGKKAQIQMEAIQKCNMMLQEINASIDAQLDTHRNKVATRLDDSRRRHQGLSQRTLALAVKVQVLRNRGYVMDNAEEELKSKLETLSREIMDPSLEAREQEIWARMLGIRERAKRLKVEMDKLTPTAPVEEPLLDEETVKAAKQTLEAYDIQLRHLHKELQLIQQEYDDWEKLSEGREQVRLRRR